ncbi:MAG TPA: hypothetical protein P5181_00845 [Dermatophilaceae bacterium]|nr:hypothetical protein [Dermatophilaceae bacterium]
MLTHLEIGAQRQAGAVLREAAVTVDASLARLTDAVIGTDGDLVGSAADAAYQALGAWLEASLGLGPALQGYAACLEAVDLTVARSQEAQVAGYQALRRTRGAL